MATPLTYSRISREITCGRNAALTAEHGNRTSEIMRLGSCVHALIETQDETEAQIMQAYKLGLDQAEEARRMGDRGRKILADRVGADAEVHLEWSAAFAMADGVLQPLAAAVGDRNVYEGAAVAGSLDALILKPNGSILILDWKSGWKRESDRLQALMYTLLASRWFDTPAEQIVFEFIHLRGFGDEGYTFSSEELAGWEAQLATWPDTDDSPTPGAHCGYCPWASDCPAVGVHGIPTNEAEADALGARVLVLQADLAQSKVALESWMDGNGPAAGWAWAQSTSKAYDVVKAVENVGGYQEAVLAGLLSINGTKARGKRAAELLGDSYTEIVKGGWKPAKGE